MAAADSLIPSTSFMNARYPSALSRRVLTLNRHRRKPTVIEIPTMKDPVLPAAAPVAESTDSANHFLTMPSVNLNMGLNMDVRKWGWPEALTIGRSAGKKPSIPGSIIPPTNPDKTPENDEVGPSKPIALDESALEDAISSHNAHSRTPSITSYVAPSSGGHSPPAMDFTSDAASVTASELPSITHSNSGGQSPRNDPVEVVNEIPDTSTPSYHDALAVLPTPVLSSIHVHLESHEGSSDTILRKLSYLTVSNHYDT